MGFPLVKNKNPSINQISKGWKKHFSSLESVHKKFDKKIQEKIKIRVPQEYWKLNYWNKLYTKRSELQSITHVDFSARIQTVSKRTNQRYWSLINEFKKITDNDVVTLFTSGRNSYPSSNRDFKEGGDYTSIKPRRE